MHWHGFVWCNPPYGSEITPFMEKMKSHGNGIALVFARTETKWFVNNVWNGADALLFFHKRITFYDIRGNKAEANAGAPSVLVAYGDTAVNRLLKSGIDGTFIDLNVNKQ